MFQAENGVRKSRRAPRRGPRGNHLMGAQPERQGGHASALPSRKASRVSSQTSTAEES